MKICEKQSKESSKDVDTFDPDTFFIRGNVYTHPDIKGPDKYYLCVTTGRKYLVSLQNGNLWSNVTAERPFWGRAVDVKKWVDVTDKVCLQV